MESATQEFLDANQYTHKSIRKYERIFGETFVSTGGLQTAQKFCSLLRLDAQTRVLDIGVGSGGVALHMVREYGAHVTGIDLSANMISLASQRREQLLSEPLRSRLHVHTGDVTQYEYPAATFDVIHSRDTFLHVADKCAVFARLCTWLRPGGRLLITDYCVGAGGGQCADFRQYTRQRGYHLVTVKEYGELLRKAGFRSIEATDNREYFLEILRTELEAFRPSRDQFVQEFSEEDYDSIVNNWESKIKRVEGGSQTWGLFTAMK